MNLKKLSFGYYIEHQDEHIEDWPGGIKVFTWNEALKQKTPLRIFTDINSLGINELVLLLRKKRPKFKYIDAHGNEITEEKAKSIKHTFEFFIKVNEGKFEEALTYCSSLTNSFTGSQLEIISSTLKYATKGKELMSQGKFGEAFIEFLQASESSQTEELTNIYINCCESLKKAAKAEVLFANGNTQQALEKYNKAFNKSNATEFKKLIYIQMKASAILNNSEAAHKMFEEFEIIPNEKEFIIEKQKNELEILRKQAEVQWEEGWITENDEPEVAKIAFESCKEMFEYIVQIDSGCESSKLDLERVKFKIMGNEAYNCGLELQEKGIMMYEKASAMKQDERSYTEAKNFFEVSKLEYLKALAAFQNGAETGYRNFEYCKEITQKVIDDIVHQIVNIINKIKKLKNDRVEAVDDADEIENDLNYQIFLQRSIYSSRSYLKK